jgi:hypothetical protein
MEPAHGLGPARVRVPRRQDEHPSAHALRAAEINGYPDPSWLLPGVGKRSVLARAAPSHPRICLECLYAEAWLRPEWDLPLVLVCSTHGCFLTDTCETCHTRITWRRQGLARCRCGARLLASGPQPDRALHDLAGAIVGLASGKALGPGAAPFSTPDAAAQLVWFIGTSLVADGSGWRSLHMSRPAVSEARAPAAAGAPALLDWPFGLHMWIEAQRRTPADGPGVLANFGPALHRLDTALSGRELTPVREEVKRWLSEEWQEGGVKPWSPLFTKGSPSATLSVKAAARLLGVSGKRASRMVSSGAVRGVLRAGGRRRFGFVTQEAVGEFLAGAATTLTPTEVADLLGIGVRQLARLAKSGLVRSLPATASLGRGRRYSGDTVRRVQLVLDATARPGPAPESGVALSELSRSRRVCFTKVIEAAAAGRLSLWRAEPRQAGPLFADYQILIEEAADLRTAAAIGQEPVACLSVREAAGRLGLSVRMVPALIAAGCLDSAVPAKADRPLQKRAVTASSVAAFPGKYVTLGRLAAARGTNTRSLLARLTLAGVRPVVRSDPGRGVSSVWRADDV